MRGSIARAVLMVVGALGFGSSRNDEEIELRRMQKELEGEALKHSRMPSYLQKSHNNYERKMRREDARARERERATAPKMSRRAQQNLRRATFTTGAVMYADIRFMRRFW